MSAAVTAWVVLALSALVPGWLLLRPGAPGSRGGAGRGAGLALAVAGLALMAAVVAGLARQPGGAAVLAAFGLGLAGPLAVVLVPRARWADPVDLLAVVAVVGAGATALVWPAATSGSALTSVGAIGARTWWALERSRGDDRRAITWVALACSSGVFVSGVVGFAFPGPPAADLAPLALAGVGPAIWLGTRRPQVDGRDAVAQVVSHVVTVLVLVAAHVGAMSLFAPQGMSPAALPVWAIAAALLATVYHSVQTLLRGTVEEAVRGYRADPLRAADEVTTRLGTDLADGLHAVCDSLALPWVALEDGDGAVVASSGAVRPQPTRTERLLLADGLGALEIGLREHDDRLGRADLRVLALVLPLLARSMHLRALADQLVASRRQVVLAREEERRRLRRDLHDGLGPLLSGLAFTADAAGNLVERDPDTAAALLVDLRTQAGAALDDVRRLVYGMRPPALDELGLVPAVQQVVDRLRTPSGSPLEVAIDGSVPARLPAAVEVAAYRIAVEAVTNVARHSTAASCSVRVDLRDGNLVVEVLDPGRGSPGPWRGGVGLASMRERAAEVGGSLRAGRTPDGGSVVALLPLEDPVPAAVRS